MQAKDESFFFLNVRFHMKEENKGYMKKVQMLTRQNQPTSPVISMSDLIARASDNVFPESDRLVAFDIMHRCDNVTIIHVF